MLFVSNKNEFQPGKTAGLALKLLLVLVFLFLLLIFAGCARNGADETDETEETEETNGLNGEETKSDNETDGENNEAYAITNLTGGSSNGTSELAQACNPAWSPDGEKIAFDALTGGSQDIFVLNADGTDLTRLTDRPGHDHLRPAWSPDGQKIAFESRRGAQIDLRIINAGGTAPAKLASLSNLEEMPYTAHRLFAWSPDSKKIAYESFEDFNIYLINAGGGGLTKLTGEPGHSSGPAWSPDGEKIAFEHQGGDTLRSDIYLIHADGTGLANLTGRLEYIATAMGPHLGFAWSPDGDKIAFSYPGGGQYDIYVINADGTGLANLTGDPDYDEFPAWSPDGKKIAFVSGNALKVINADGTGLTQLAAGPAPLPDSGLAWSPDGKKIAFSGRDKGRIDIFVIEVDSTD